MLNQGNTPALIIIFILSTCLPAWQCISALWGEFTCWSFVGVKGFMLSVEYRVRYAQEIMISWYAPMSIIFPAHNEQCFGSLTCHGGALKIGVIRKEISAKNYPICCFQLRSTINLRTLSISRDPRPPAQHTWKILRSSDGSRHFIPPHNEKGIYFRTCEYGIRQTS